MFVAFLIASALAAEPVAPVATTSPTIAARDAYLTSLNAQREAVGGGDPRDMCETAKGSFRGAQSELARIDAELALPANPDLGKAQVDYRAKLVALKAAQAKAMETAKSSAKTAGAQMAADDAKKVALDAEITRVEKEIQREKDAAKPSSRSTGLGGLGSIGQTEGLGDLGRTTLYGYGGLGAYPHPAGFLAHDESPIPAEFTGCFPGEVGTSS